jgi:hypothetical protein
MGFSRRSTQRFSQFSLVSTTFNEEGEDDVILVFTDSLSLERSWVQEADEVGGNVACLPCSAQRKDF